MDFLPPSESIDRVFCGWFQTFIRTKKGKIYSTIRNSERKKKKAVEEKEAELVFSEDEESKREEGARFKSRRRKNTEDYRGEDHRRQKGQKRFEEQQHWGELEAGKAFFVEAFKEYTFVIQCPEQQRF
jgi:hypothetical protein